MKSQAAMEFILTYGWAILVVLIAIGALSFFGVLKPQGLLPATCELGPGFACKDFAIYNTTNNISMKLINGFGKNFEVFVIYVNKESLTSSEICGGYVGLIADPFFDLTPVNQIFKNGEVKPIYSLYPGGSPKEGLRCKNNNNCCGDTNWDHLNLCPSFTSGAVCSQALPPKGSRFNEDLMILYKEVGSTIIHSRKGKLAGMVE